MGMAYASISNLGQTAFGNVSNLILLHLLTTKLILAPIRSSGPSVVQQSLERTCSPSTSQTRAMEAHSFT